MLRTGLLLAAAALLLPTPSDAGNKKKHEPVVLSEEHAHPAGGFSFRTPAGWTSAPVAGQPDLFETSNGALVARFLWRQGEAGYDSLHADCMLERLAGAMETSPRVAYEYDFLGGAIGSRRILDSAFVVEYDAPVLGHRAWRQRNVTVVGEGTSLCIITHAPSATWRKSPEVRELLDGIVKSVTFR